MNESSVAERIDARIVSFLKQNTVLTLAVSKNNIPYCANCFYAYDEEKNTLVFKSKRETEHIRQALGNENVSGTILPNKLDLAKIQGVQFNGIFLKPRKELIKSLKKIYYAKYPFALTFIGEVWAVELTNVKFTDNTLGFGKKSEWIKSCEKV